MNGYEYALQRLAIASEYTKANPNTVFWLSVFMATFVRVHELNPELN